MGLPMEFVCAGACILARRAMGCRRVYRWNCVRRRVYTGAPADGLSMGFADEFSDLPARLDAEPVGIGGVCTDAES